MKKINYMFDTTAFNSFVKGEMPVKLIAGHSIYATHIQWDELNDTKDDELKAALTQGFMNISPTSVSTESAAWKVSKWGKSKWATDDMCRQIKFDLDKLKKHHNNKKDALIAETAIKHDFTLVTNDNHLTAVTHRYGGNSIDFEDFLEVYGEIN